MAFSRPHTSHGRPGQFQDGPDPKLQFDIPPFDPAETEFHNHVSDPRGEFNDRPRGQDFRPEIHQDNPPRHNSMPNSSLQRRASVGRGVHPGTFQGMPGTFPGGGIGGGGGDGRGRPVVIQHGHLPERRYVSFQKRTGKFWEKGSTIYDHIMMEISPEDAERRIRRHEESGKGLSTVFNGLAFHQQSHIGEAKERLNKAERDSGWRWVTSAVGKEKPEKPNATKTFWAIYSRLPKGRKGSQRHHRHSIGGPQPQMPHGEPRGRPTPQQRQHQAPDSFKVQPVQIPPPPRPSDFPGTDLPSPPGAFPQHLYGEEEPFGPGNFPAPEPPRVTPRPNPNFDYNDGPRIREVEPPIPGAFPQYQDHQQHYQQQQQGREPLPRPTIRSQLPQGTFGAPGPYSNAPGDRSSMPTMPGSMGGGIGGGMGGGGMGGMPNGMPGGMPSGMPSGMLSGMPGGVPGGAPGGMPNGLRNDHTLRDTDFRDPRDRDSRLPSGQMPRYDPGMNPHHSNSHHQGPPSSQPRRRNTSLTRSPDRLYNEHESFSTYREPRHPDSHHRPTTSGGPRRVRAATNPNHATTDFADWDLDKMRRTDRWVESSASGSSGVGSPTGSPDSFSGANGEYVLNPPPPARPRSPSIYDERERGREYHSSNHHSLPRSRSVRESRRYSSYNPSHEPQPLAIEYDYAIAGQNGVAGRGPTRYRTVYRDQDNRQYRRSMSRKRSGYFDSRDRDEYEYESADDIGNGMRDLRIGGGREGPGRQPRYTMYRGGMVSYGR